MNMAEMILHLKAKFAIEFGEDEQEINEQIMADTRARAHKNKERIEKWQSLPYSERIDVMRINGHWIAYPPIQDQSK